MREVQSYTEVPLERLEQDDKLSSNESLHWCVPSRALKEHEYEIAELTTADTCLLQIALISTEGGGYRINKKNSRVDPVNYRPVPIKFTPQNLVDATTKNMCTSIYIGKSLQLSRQNNICRLKRSYLHLSFCFSFQPKA